MNLNFIILNHMKNQNSKLMSQKYPQLKNTHPEIYKDLQQREKFYLDIIYNLINQNENLKSKCQTMQNQLNLIIKQMNTIKNIRQNKSISPPKITIRYNSPSQGITQTPITKLNGLQKNKNQSMKLNQKIHFQYKPQNSVKQKNSANNQEKKFHNIKTLECLEIHQSEIFPSNLSSRNANITISKNNNTVVHNQNKIQTNPIASNFNKSNGSIQLCHLEDLKSLNKKQNTFGDELSTKHTIMQNDSVKSQENLLKKNEMQQNKLFEQQQEKNEKLFAGQEIVKMQIKQNEQKNKKIKLDYRKYLDNFQYVPKFQQKTTYNQFSNKQLQLRTRQIIDQNYQINIDKLRQQNKRILKRIQMLGI